MMKMNRNEIKAVLETKLKKSRYEHTLGVEYTAACLAMRYGADLHKADLAGLLHDCGKYLPTSEKLNLCRELGLPISETEEKNPELLHAKLGVYIAKEDYGIEDEEILSAIRWHTTGRPGMSLLEKIIFIADYIEPNRDKAKNLRRIRSLAFTDLDACLRMILSDTVAYLATCNHVTDPMTKETWDYYRLASSDCD